MRSCTVELLRSKLLGSCFLTSIAPAATQHHCLQSSVAIESIAVACIFRGYYPAFSTLLLDRNTLLEYTHGHCTRNSLLSLDKPSRHAKSARPSRVLPIRKRQRGFTPTQEINCATKTIRWSFMLTHVRTSQERGQKAYRIVSNGRPIWLDYRKVGPMQHASIPWESILMDIYQ